MYNRKKIDRGVYLIIDPQMERNKLLKKLKACLTMPLSAIQIWDHFKPGSNPDRFVEDILKLLDGKPVPLLINNRWELLRSHALDGVHFDHIPEDLQDIRSDIARPFICGLTCQNDLREIARAETLQMDYLSFCSMFPSETAQSCELVDFSSVKRAAQIFSGQLFLAGGIRPENLAALDSLPYDGIAVISGIMSSAQPAKQIQTYLQHKPIKI